MSSRERPVRPEDDGFLFELYADTLREELDAWGWEPDQREAFLRMQFTAQRRAYESQHPRANQRIFLLGDRPIGRIVVDRTDQEICLVDIALLAEHRGAGIGTTVIQGLLDEAVATGKPVRLQVVKSNRAVRLYERLGFTVVGDSGVRLAMEWRLRSPEG